MVMLLIWQMLSIAWHYHRNGWKFKRMSMSNGIIEGQKRKKLYEPWYYVGLQCDFQWKSINQLIAMHVECGCDYMLKWWCAFNCTIKTIVGILDVNHWKYANYRLLLGLMFILTISFETISANWHFIWGYTVVEWKKQKFQFFITTVHETNQNWFVLFILFQCRRLRLKRFSVVVRRFHVILNQMWKMIVFIWYYGSVKALANHFTSKPICSSYFHQFGP